MQRAMDLSFPLKNKWVFSFGIPSDLKDELALFIDETKKDNIL